MSIIASPAFSLEPNKLVLYTRFDKMSQDLAYPEYVRQYTAKEPLIKSFHNFKISENAYRSLKRKINWLYYLSKKKDITTYSGKRIFSFRCAFITFTLPSSQKTNTGDVTKRLFNHLLTVLRDRYGLVNYVWRLEFQRNGNVHYHMVTDSYIDYHAVLKIWNKILNTEGYINEYAEKHMAMSLNDYVSRYSKNDKSKFKILKKRYFIGKCEGWKNPNTVDVKSVISKSKIANYVSKYFGKADKSGCSSNPLDNEENSKSLRLWFCSRSLSKLKTISDYLQHVDFKPEALVRFCQKFRRVRLEYAVIYFFELKELTGFARSFLEKLYKTYAKNQGYVPV